MRRLKLPIAFFAALALAACSTTAASDNPAPAAVVETTSPEAPAAAPIAELVRAVDIPYEQFTLDNGLRVVVPGDRKAPIDGVSIRQTSWQEGREGKGGVRRC